MEDKYKLKSIKICLSLFLILCFMLSIAGCGKSSAVPGNYRSVDGSVIESQLLASNSEHELYWNQDAKAIVLKSIKTGKYWSDILYDSFLEGSTSANANSPLSITVSNNISLKWDTVRSYNAINENGKIICKKIKNGIRVTYFFDTYKIAIPVDYTLNDDSLEVSIQGDQILEDGSEYRLVSISLTPFLCSVSNENENNYLFVPAGSGALMYSKVTPDGERSYIGEVYGADVSRRLAEDYTDDESVKLPIFGASDGTNAMLGIIEQSAGAAFIEAQSGNERIGYSNVGATFYFRGYDTFRYASHGTGNIITQRVGDNIVKKKASVSYYPLYGEEANYNGMAKKYRQYLIENNSLKNSDITDSYYSVTLLGGTTVPTSTLGIPSKKLVSLTDFSQGLEIVKDLTQKTASTPMVRLMNYGDNGMTPGTVSVLFESVFGSKNQLKLLNDYCKQKNSTLFMDSEIIFYTKSGNGFGINTDSARTAIRYKALQYNVSPIRIQDVDNPVYVLSRDKLIVASNKVLKKARECSTSGISFSSLGYTAYSDYKSEKYPLKESIENDTSEIFGKLSSAGYKTATSAANSYAACAADVLFDTPIANGNYNAFDEYIPFYQMVFHSYKAMYSTATNLEENYEMSVMRAATTGMGLGFYLTNDYISDSNELDLYKLYGTVYKDNVDRITETLNNSSFKECYLSVKDAVLQRYELPENGISKSYFSNGKIIYANHTSETVDSAIGKLKPYGYIIK